MLDTSIRRLLDPTLHKVAAYLFRAGIHANMLTGLGFVFALFAFGALAAQAYGLAIIFIVISRLMDGLDGPLARQSAATDIGAYLDIVSDFIFYGGAVFFFALGRPDMALAAAFLLFSFMGTASSFLAYAILAAKRGKVMSENRPKKSFFYHGGITEGSETIALLILICLYPDAFAWLAGVFGILCWMTTMGRTHHAVQDFKEGQIASDAP